MRVIVFGATGLLGQGVLEACLQAPDVTEVLVVARSTTGREHPKLREIEHRDFTDYSAVADRLVGYDGCFFCLGTTSAGKQEAQYRIANRDIPIAAARAVLAANPEAAFCYVSGAGTDAGSRLMWARVKGETENALLALGTGTYMFRPAIILPLPGARLRSRLNTALYAVIVPAAPLLRRMIPDRITSAVEVGRAMIRTAEIRPPDRVLENARIVALSASSAP